MTSAVESVHTPAERPTDFSGVFLATDLDGTFLGARGSMVEANLRAVERFKALGGHFTCATGRILHSVLESIPESPTLFNAPLITSNGTYIYDLATATLLDATPMDPDPLKAAVAESLAAFPRVGVRVSAEKGFLVAADNLTPDLEKVLVGKNFLGDVLPLSRWSDEGNPWYKVIFYGAPEELVSLRAALAPTYGSIFEFCTSSATLFEMEAPGCDKASGVSFVARHLEGVTGRPILTVTAGDYENDLPMVRSAHLSGAPANAMEALREAATYTLCPHTEGSIADLLDRVEAYITRKM